MKIKNRTTSKNNNSGITLIALVITIIVLLILAGVTIASLTGENGLLERASRAKDETKRGDLIERVKIDILDNEIGKGIGEEDKLSEVLGKYFKTVPSELTNIDTELTAKAEYGGYKVTLKELFGQAVAGGSGGGDDMPTVIVAPKEPVSETTKYDDGTNKADGTSIAVIPNGFKVINGGDNPKIDDGLVVKDGADNEWVWISVPDASVMYTHVDEGIAITGGSGKTYVSGVTTNYYSNTILSGKRRGLPNSSNYREPDVVVGSGTQFDAANYSTAGFTSLENMAQSLVDDYEDMIESVEKNKGFYVGRYELSGTSASPTEVSGQPLTNQNWYNLYYACKHINTGTATADVVEARMIWGCQWDMVCNFIANYGEKKNINDSSTWGNYKTTDVTSSDGSTIIKANGTSTKLDTGVTTFTMANKIYDIAGNCVEWTQEAYLTNYRDHRGRQFLQLWLCLSSFWPQLRQHSVW